MARELRRWVVATLVACGVIALALLPPRGAAVTRARLVFAIPQSTPARLRAQALAAEWRAADGAARLLDQRARARSVLSSPEARKSSVTVVLTGPQSIPPEATARVASAMDSAWAAVGLGETKIGVVMVIDLGPTTVAGSTSAPGLEGPMYLEPDSANRTTCVALVPAGPYWNRFILGMPGQERSRPYFVQWLQASLGPCAFYATYGAPSKTVRRWLAARHWDIGRFLNTENPFGRALSSSDLLGDPRYPWYWERIYTFSPSTVACMAGRPAECRAAVLRASDGTARGDSLPRIVRTEPRRWWQRQDLIPGERYLSDMARAVGRERFLGFWGSPLPVDTSLALALRTPVGDWTAEWQHRYTPRLRLGPAAPVTAYALAVTLGVVVLFGAALAAQRRQVR